jgi:twitching motility protein PilT
MPAPALDDLLRMVVEQNGSDLHIKAHEPPILRIHGVLTRTNFAPLSPEETKTMMYAIMTEERQRRFERKMELDQAYAVPGLARFRVNVYKQRGCVGAALRLIPLRVQTIDELGLPQVLKRISLIPRGLVLVTGPTGSGKSTSLAAMIDWINEHKAVHVITIEDPIEFMHTDKVAAIEQREVEIDTHSFADGLRHVMRQNPDVILVGEMRDLETMQLAITAAETGHLVFATVHTTDAAQTMDRIVDVFEPDRQQQIRLQLSVVIQAVVSQTLLPRCDVAGRAAAFEIMMATPAIRNLIREAKTHQIYATIQTGHDLGMQTLDGHLLQLHRQGLVTFEDAAAKSSNPSEFRERAKIMAAVGAAGAAGAAGVTSAQRTT